MDITRRAGVSRSSFFNYFGSKSDILWAGFDERVDAAVQALAEGAGVPEALSEIVDGLAPDALALAIVHAEAMGIDDELVRETSMRAARIADAVARRLERDGIEPLQAEVCGGAYSAAVLAAVRAWAHQGAGRAPLQPLLERALGMAALALP